jgi:hypothetical protein
MNSRIIDCSELALQKKAAEPAVAVGGLTHNP